MKNWWHAIDEHFFKKPNSHQQMLLEIFDYERSIRHLLDRFLKDKALINYENIMNESNLIYVIYKFEKLGILFLFYFRYAGNLKNMILRWILSRLKKI